jgi:hypothetical protein
LKDPDRQRRFVHVCPFVELQWGENQSGWEQRGFFTQKRN